MTAPSPRPWKGRAAQLILEQCHRHGERAFLLDSRAGRQLSYREFGGLACELAERLQRHGLARGDRVALLLPNGPELALCYFACMMADIVAVPVNPQLHPSDVAYILELAAPRLQVRPTDAGTMALDGVGGGGEIPSIWDIPPRKISSMPAAADDAADGIATIHFTSGTTGRPKGVCHRVDGLFGAADGFCRLMGLGAEHRFLHILPMTYMAGFLNTLLVPFLSGGSVVLAAPFTAQTVLSFWKTVRQHEANSFWLNPTILSALLSLDRDPEGPAYCRSSVKTVCVGTAPLPLRVKTAFEERYGVEVFESYGLSELLFIAGSSPTMPREQGTVGRTLDGVKLAVGADGEILVQTPFLMAGYLGPDGQPEGAADGAFFPTGDLGRLTVAGNLEITGRLKDIIIRGGLNISPRAIETVLYDHPAVDQAAVVGVEHDLYGEEVVAAVSLKSGHDPKDVRVALEALCRARLAAATLPNRYVDIAAMPLNSSGKIDKQAVRRLLGPPRSGR